MLMTEHSARDEATQAVCDSNRAQPYRFIHKALRALMSRTLHQVSSLDPAVTDERAEMVSAVDELLAICESHLGHENAFFHAPLAARAPRAVLPFEDDHRDHLQAIAALRALTARLADGGPDAPQVAYRLTLQLTRFIAENLEHMADEETLLTRTLWAHFTDAEIAGFGAGIHAQLTPEQNAYYLRWMARALNPSELQALLTGARAEMPEPAFDGVCELMAGVLPAPRWARLARALGRAPVPGLVTV